MPEILGGGALWGGTVLLHVLPNVANRLIHHPDKPDGVFLFGTASSTRITPDNAESSPLPDPHESGERGLARWVNVWR